MAFTPRTFQEILADMIAYVQSRTDITDFTVGSAVRTILEAAALEDDEQYFQMVQLLDMFAIANATGENLDRRLAEFNISREPSQAASGTVRFFNSNLITDQAAQDSSAGSTSLRIFNSTGFPTSASPYALRIAEGTSRMQDAVVTSLSPLNHLFTLTNPLVHDVQVGDRVSFATGATSHSISLNTVIQAPATSLEPAKLYTTRQAAFIPAGSFFSNAVRIKSNTPGTGGNLAESRISQFVGSPPFSGAGVTNASPVEGGRRVERDRDFRARGLDRLQSLARGTPLAIRSSAVGVTDRATGQRVVSANLVEDFTRSEVITYIDDGTGLTPDIVALPQGSLAAGAAAGVSSLTLVDASQFPPSGYVLVEGQELLFYSAVSTNTLIFPAVTTDAHAGGDIVRFVEIVTEGAESGQRRFRVRKPPVVRNTERVWVKPPADPAWAELSPTQFRLNRGTGDLILSVGVGAGTAVVVFYNYYTNLIAEVQRVLEGVPGSTSYPGVKAAGVFLSVEAPVIRRVTVRASISAESGFVEADLAPRVQRAIETYILSLKIGDDVIRSKIIEAAHTVRGVRSVSIASPSSNLVVLESELPVPFSITGESLVTVL